MSYSINQIFEGDYEPEAAQWCNNNNAIIVEIEPFNDTRRFQIQAVPAPTTDELKARARAIRDNYLRTYIDPIAGNCLRWAELTDTEKTNITNYRLYLLNYPQQEGSWWTTAPKTYEEWKTAQSADTNTEGA